MLHRRSNRKGSRNWRHTSQSLQTASRKYKPGFGICFQSFGTTSTIHAFAGSYSLKDVLPALVPEHDL